MFTFWFVFVVEHALVSARVTVSACVTDGKVARYTLVSMLFGDLSRALANGEVVPSFNICITFHATVCPLKLVIRLSDHHANNGNLNKIDILGSMPHTESGGP